MTLGKVSPFLLALALVLAACGGGQAPPPPSLAVRPSPGCQNPQATAYEGAGASQVQELTVDGTVRTYRLYVPSSAHPDTPAPIVYNFHGLGSNAREQEAYSQLLPLAEGEGFILVSPDGLGNPRAWFVPGLSMSLGDPERDLRFFDALHQHLSRTLCLDLGRVYATGMSNGAFFSSALACQRPEVLAAIAPVAGVFYPPQGCREAVPVIAFHGTNDAIVPYGEGLIFNIIPYDGAEAYVQMWAGQNGCQGPARQERLGREVVHLTYGGCRAPAELIVVEGGGHTWPGSVDVPRLGYTTHEISAAQMMWDFFQAVAQR